MADIQHMAGQNVVAVALSRPPVSSVTAQSPTSEVVADLRGIAACQSSCPSMLQASRSPSLQVRACEVEGVSMLCDVSTRRMRPTGYEFSGPFMAWHILEYEPRAE
jgi:hypothetical protein